MSLGLFHSAGVFALVDPTIPSFSLPSCWRGCHDKRLSFTRGSRHKLSGQTSPDHLPCAELGRGPEAMTHGSSLRDRRSSRPPRVEGFDESHDGKHPEQAAGAFVSVIVDGCLGGARGIMDPDATSGGRGAPIRYLDGKGSKRASLDYLAHRRTQSPKRSPFYTCQVDRRQLKIIRVALRFRCVRRVTASHRDSPR